MDTDELYILDMIRVDTDLRERHQKNIYFLWALVLLSVISTLCLASLTSSDDFTELRVTSGARIFRALLAADEAIERKAGNDKILNIFLLFQNNARNAEKARDTLLNRDDIRIRKIAIHVEIMSIADFEKKTSISSAGIFLTDLLTNENLAHVMERARKYHTVVFSPFEGDVERGVHSGIAVEARVRPFLNLESIHSAGIRLKPFFLKVAKTYGKSS